MGVTISGVTKKKPEPVLPAAPHRPKTLHRDTRDDPMGTAMKALLSLPAPTKAQMMDAWNEMLPLVNLVPYWSEEGWAPVFKRYGAMYGAILAGKVKDVKGLMKQITDAYRKVMKNGKWQGDRFGKAEPK